MAFSKPAFRFLCLTLRQVWGFSSVHRQVCTRASTRLFGASSSVDTNSSHHFSKWYTTPVTSGRDPLSKENGAETKTDLVGDLSDEEEIGKLTDEEIKVKYNESLVTGLETEFPSSTAKGVTVAGPEPHYELIVSGYKTYHHKDQFDMKYNEAYLPEFKLAYETWGELNESRSNAILVWTGLSAHSHVRSHPGNTKPGWWENFVGPGFCVDTSRFFVICANHLGGCFGSTGPSSKDPRNGEPYATSFPIITVEDFVNAQMKLLDHLGIEKLHASVGSSLGGMCSLTSAALYPERISRCITISSCAATHPSSIASRYLQRRTIMADPHWNRGYYYDGPYPRLGLKLAREIAFITYRSGPEWEHRFGRKLIEGHTTPTLSSDFLIESYLDHQGLVSSMNIDANTLLYITKAMDYFDISDGFSSMKESLKRVKCPIMVIGVQTDHLFPVEQQRYLAKTLIEAGNDTVTYYELNSIYGHDTFLLDLNSVGTAIQGFLETNRQMNGNGRKKEFVLRG